MGQDTVLATVKRFKNALESINIRVDQLKLRRSKPVSRNMAC